MATRDKGYKGVGMEGRIARWYATNTGRDLTRFREQAEQAAAYLKPGNSVLEVAPGPGYLSIELAKTGEYTVTGLDISETFVEIATGNAARAGVRAEFRHGNAARMPFADESFDLVVCCAAFKNFSAPVDALREMRRVLRPGGTALVFDLRRDLAKESVDDEVARIGATGLNRIVTAFTLRSVLPRRAYTKAQFEELIGQTEFRSFEVRQTPLSLEVEMRK